MLCSRARILHMLQFSVLRLILMVLLLQSRCQSSNPRLQRSKRKTDSSASKRIIGGEDAPLGRFPYMCSIRARGARQHKCGGTLVKPQWVLTAAHCLDPKVEGSTGLSPIVFCGIYERNERNSNKAFSTVRSFLHPEWKGDIVEGYDIALIKLERPYESPLPDMDTVGNFHKPGRVFAALGWGVNLSGHFAEVLQIAPRLPFVARRTCNLKEYWNGQIIDSMTCAGTGEQDTARGDSGGPLLQLDRLGGDYTLGEASFDLLVGITSFGENSRSRFKPGVYSSVSYFREWIDCIIEEEEKCSKDGKGSTKTSDDAHELRTVSSNATLTEQNATQPSHASETSSIPPETSRESSAEAPEPLAEGSEEAAERLEDILDLCPDVTLERIVTDSFELERARAAIKEDDFETVAGLLCAGLSPDSEFALNSTEFTLGYAVADWTLLGEASRYDAVMSARILIDYGADIEKRNKYRYQPIHLAARYNSLGVAKLLLKSGADIEGRGLNSGTPLYAAAEKDSLAVAKFLIRKGAEIDSRAAWERTPLFRATVFDALEVVELLIDAGANTSIVDSFGSTLLHVAVYRGSVQLVKVLVDLGLDVDAKDNERETPLHNTANNNRFDLAKFLVESGASKNEKDEDGDTPLHKAARYGSLEVVEVLVDSGVDINTKNNEGLTPLYYAASRNRFDIAKFLVENGASKTETDNDGNTPYDKICTVRTFDGCSLEDRARLQRLLRV